MQEAPIVRSRELGGVAGYAIGVLHVASPFAFVPGNIQNATTLPFAAAYECVPGISLGQVLSGAPAVEVGIVAAAQRLETRGVRAIVGACGSFANFQQALTNKCLVPVFSSVLTQVPWLIGSLPRSQRLAIVFADKNSFTDRVRQQCSIDDVDRLVITDCIGLPPFRALIEEPYFIENQALEDALIQHLQALVDSNPDIGMIMLQCSELPPYAAAIQMRVGRPIVDVVTLANWLFSTVVRTPYRGYL